MRKQERIHISTSGGHYDYRQSPFYPADLTNHIRNIFRRRAQKPDPRKNMGRHASSLDAPRERPTCLMAEEHEQ